MGLEAPPFPRKEKRKSIASVYSFPLNSGIIDWLMPLSAPHNLRLWKGLFGKHLGVLLGNIICYYVYVCEERGGAVDNDTLRSCSTRAACLQGSEIGSLCLVPLQSLPLSTLMCMALVLSRWRGLATIVKWTAGKFSAGICCSLSQDCSHRLLSTLSRS